LTREMDACGHNKRVGMTARREEGVCDYELGVSGAMIERGDKLKKPTRKRVGGVWPRR
jgi:hypothetical protein